MIKKLIFLLLFMCTLALPAHAYIDPGTGSMLFSVILCSITTLFFLFNSLILKIKAKIFSEKSLSKNHHKFVIYSEGKQYYGVFKPILDEFEKRKIPVMYYSSSQDDEIFSENYEFIKSEYIGKGNRAYLKLAFLNADVCLMTTPQLDVLQLKRSKNVKHYSHIFHSIGFSMDYRLFALDYYDSVLCDASFQTSLIREVEQKRNLPPKKLPVVGSTYMDFNKNRITNIETNEKYTVLVAPSWGEYSLLNKYGSEILDKLKETDYNIIIRPHPQSLIIDKKLIDTLKEKYKASNNISWDFSADNIKALSKADILISDFSCIMMDYAFLFKKPFLYIDTNIVYEMYDCVDLEELPPWRYKVMDIIGKKLNIENGDIDNIADIINNVKNDTNLIMNIEKACNYAWEKQGESAQNAVDFLVDVQKEL